MTIGTGTAGIMSVPRMEHTSPALANVMVTSLARWTVGEILLVRESVVILGAAVVPIAGSFFCASVF